MRVAFFGSSLVSAYWNGACTYYRGIIRALDRLGFEVTFFEPDAFERQAHRDIDDPDWARVVVYDAAPQAARAAVESARDFDIIVKASGVGVNDELLEGAVLEVKRPENVVIFWDVDAPATLGSVEGSPDDPLRTLIPEYDLVFTYGGGDPVVARYEALGARRCVPIYNALDPETHHPVPAEPDLKADLSVLVNRLPDREARVEEFFFRATELLPDRHFILGGAGWEDRAGQPNIDYLGHVPPGRHNAFNCSPLAVLNVTRDSMVANGWSPATRVFEAAGAGACLLTDAWEGIDAFLEPDREVIVCRDGAEVSDALEALDAESARRIGEAARERMLTEHTYDRRAEQVQDTLSTTARTSRVSLQGRSR